MYVSFSNWKNWKVWKNKYLGEFIAKLYRSAKITTQRPNTVFLSSYYLYGDIISSTLKQTKVKWKYKI